MMTPPTMRPRPNGFTLIELMIAVAVIGILAAIALPSYQSYVKKSRRADAYRSIGSVGLAQEKFRSNNSQYSETLSDLGISSSTSSDGHYTIAITGGSASASGYIATATARGSQIGDAEGAISCNTLTLTASGSSQTYTPAECWKK